MPAISGSVIQCVGEQVPLTWMKYSAKSYTHKLLVELLQVLDLGGQEAYVFIWIVIALPWPTPSCRDTWIILMAHRMEPQT